MFTKIRNDLNSIEDEFLLDINELYEKTNINEDIKK